MSDNNIVNDFTPTQGILKKYLESRKYFFEDIDVWKNLLSIVNSANSFDDLLIPISIIIELEFEERKLFSEDSSFLPLSFILKEQLKLYQGANQEGQLKMGF